MPIFALPQADAEITTPRPDAIERSPDTANSRPITTTTIHAGARPELDERDERRRDQELVGDRVEQRAERRDLGAAASEPAVEEVGRDRRQEDHETDRLPSVELRQQDDDEKRHEEDAEQGERVWKIDLQGRPAEL